MSSPDTLQPTMAFCEDLAAEIAADFAPLAVPDKPVHVLRRGPWVALLHRHSLRLRFMKTIDFEDAGPERAIAPLLGELDDAPPPRPAPAKKVLQAIITSRCSLRCSYCTVFNLPQPALDKDMDKATLDRCLAWLHDMPEGEGQLILHGGEPLLAWDKVRWLAAQAPCDIVLFTNGLHVTPERAAELARLKVDVLVSIDGPDRVHDVARRTLNNKPSFEQSIQGFHIAKQAGCDTGISLAIGPHNAPTLARDVPWLLDTHQPASIRLELPHYTQDYTECQLDLDQVISDLQSMLKLAVERQLFLDPLAKFLRPLVQQRFAHHDCSALGEKIVVFPDGSVSNCISHVANAKGPQDLDVWNDLLPAKHQLCQGCPALGICGGGCFYDAIHFRDGCAYDLRHCTMARRMLEFLVWDIRERVQLEMPTPEDLVPVYAPMGGKLELPPARLGTSIEHESDDA